MESKHCSKCDNDYIITDFHKSGGGKRRNVCKHCCNKDRKLKRQLKLKENPKVKKPRAGKGRGCVFTKEEMRLKNVIKCRQYYTVKREDIKRRMVFLYKCKRLEKKLLTNVSPYNL